MILYLDIETLPCSDPAYIAQVADTITAPAQYKKPESIADWMAANKEQAIIDAVAKTAFDGLYGSIACICYAFDDSVVLSADVNTCGSETAMLEYFYSHVFDQTMTKHHSGLSAINTTVCGHNVAGFDLPFLKKRSIIHGVRPTTVIQKAMKAKPWDESIADTMLMWDSKNFVSMDKLCAAFGIPGKGDFDGSMVAETWQHNPQKVIDYCMGDVRRTREIYKQLTFQ